MQDSEIRTTLIHFRATINNHGSLFTPDQLDQIELYTRSMAWDDMSSNKERFVMNLTHANEYVNSIVFGE